MVWPFRRADRTVERARERADRAARAGELDRLIKAMEAGLPRTRANDRLGIALAVVMALVGLGFLAVAVASGASVGWDLDAWVDNGRAGGPLWFVLIVSGLCGGLLTAGGVYTLRRPFRATRLEEERLASFRAQRVELDRGPAGAPR